MAASPLNQKVVLWGSVGRPVSKPSDHLQFLVFVLFIFSGFFFFFPKYF